MVFSEMPVQFHRVVCQPVDDQQLRFKEHEASLRGELAAEFRFKKGKIPLEPRMLLLLQQEQRIFGVARRLMKRVAGGDLFHAATATRQGNGEPASSSPSQAKLPAMNASLAPELMRHGTSLAVSPAPTPAP